MTVGILHLVFQSPSQTGGFRQCLERTNENDAVLLLGGAVVGAKKASTVSKVLKQSSATIYVLEEDLAARGIAPEALLDSITLVSFAEFVGLTETYSRILSW
ncbi:MAG: hypothetical protein AXA67_10375 [Methylothermaceae bacteria B42]|nr:MAG: hypothetical protein AXA67_10375 [Methylothermaceae bacteria B42]HHJ40526.1 sulfurtransferase complex subunit TusB [Methylothermaceae bacterium]